MLFMSLVTSTYGYQDPITNLYPEKIFLLTHIIINLTTHTINKISLTVDKEQYQKRSIKLSVSPSDAMWRNFDN